MNKNAKILSKGKNNNFNDKIYTPAEIVKEILDWVKPTGRILEPARGNGAFSNELIKRDLTHWWCEIDEGVDFFEVDPDFKYDYIITNPPWSIFTKFLEQCFKMADNVVLLIPHNKLYTSDKRLDMIENFGTFTYKRFKVPKEWPTNFPIAAYWFKKNKFLTN